MGSPEVNRIPTSSSPSSSLQNSPFFNYLSNLSPLNLHNLPRAGETRVELNFPSPPPVFASPRVNPQREAGFLKRKQYQSSSDAEKFFEQIAQNGMYAAASDVAQLSVYQSTVELIPRTKMDTEPCSPDGSVDKFLVDPLEDCGRDTPDLCSKKSSDLPQHFQSGCISFNEILVGNDQICKDKETEAAATLYPSEPVEENQVVEESLPHMEIVQTESHMKGICEAEQKNDERLPNELQDLVSKNASGLPEPFLSMDSASSKQDNLHFMHQTAKDLTPLLSSCEEYGFIECQKEMPVCSTGIDNLRTEDIKLHPAQGGQLGEWDCTPQMLHESFPNDQVDEINCENDGAMSHGKAESQMPYDFREHAQQQRGMRRRCLQFEALEARKKSIRSNSSWNATDVSDISLPADVTDSEILNASNGASNKSSSDQQLVIFSKKASCRFPTHPLKTSENHIDKVERSAQNSGSSHISAPTPSGIGLHLNRIGSTVVDRSDLNRQSTTKEYQHVEGEKSTFESNCHSSKCLNSRFMHSDQVGNLSVNVKTMAGYSLACSDHINNEVEEQKDEASTLPNSSSSLQISTFEVSPLKSSLSINLIEEDAMPSEKKWGAPEDISYSEFNQASSRKNRKKEANSIVGEGCKHCNCKKSKCLKLYCDCFAAGVYCSGLCSCQECFNKPEHEDTVLETRQQIESRDPLAFAPKIVQCATESPQNSGEDGNRTTPASARHKRGCNCKKSKCLKKYCECYQAGVGCSVGCRCERCENLFGRKGELGEITEMEHGKAKDEQCEEFHNRKQGRMYIKSTILDQIQRHSDHITLPMPLLQCSKYRKNAPKSQIHSRKHMTSSLESEDMVLSSHGESLRSSRNSNSNDRLVIEVEQNACLIPHDPKLDSRSGIADQFSSKCANTCSLSPLPHFSQSRTATSEASDSRYCLKASNLQFCHKSEQMVGFLRYSSPITPTSCCSRRKFIAGPDSESVLDNVHEDEAPDILKETHSPIKGVKASSPNQKRISPPHNCLSELRRSSSSTGLKSRKFILQSVSSFPPLSPFSEPKTRDGQNTSS